MAKKTLSITNLNARAAAARGHEFELEYPAGKGLGVFLNILGEQAQVVEDFEVELADRRAEQSLQDAQRAAKDEKIVPRSAKAQLKDNLERALVRVTGWRGLQEDFSPEMARELLTNNPDFIDQVLTESRTRGNFTNA